MAKTMNEKRFMELALYCPFCGGKDLELTKRVDFNALVKEHGGACIKVNCRTCDCVKYDFTTSIEDKTKDAKDYGKRLERLLVNWNTRCAGVTDNE